MPLYGLGGMRDPPSAQQAAMNKIWRKVTNPAERLKRLRCDQHGQFSESKSHPLEGRRLLQVRCLLARLARARLRAFLPLSAREDTHASYAPLRSRTRARGIHDQDPTRVLPDYTARVNQLRMQEQIVERLSNEFAKQQIDHIAERNSLKPFDYSKYGLGEVLRDQELRAHLRGLPPAERNAAKEREPFARAILGAEPELSGLSPAEHGLMQRRELLSRYPETVARLDAEELSIEFTKQTLETVKRALSEERSALAVTAPLEPAKVPASRVWK